MGNVLLIRIDARGLNVTIVVKWSFSDAEFYINYNTFLKFHVLFLTVKVLIPTM